MEDRPLQDDLRKRSRNFLLLAAFILAALIPSFIVIGVRQAIYPVGESTNDSYYHIAMADMGPATFLAKKFPYLTISTWTDNFSDKELGYHLYLWVVRSVQRILGLDMKPPFHFASFFSCLLAFGGFSFACWRMKTHPITVILASTTVAVLSAQFLFRATMVRPHMLALGLILVACGLYTTGSLRFKTISAFIVSFLFTWSYSNPHFVIIPALAFGAALYWEHGRKALFIPAASTAGFVAGLIIHPQFPNSLLMWKVQSIDAMLWPIIMDNSPISKPGEFYKPDTHWFFLSIPLMILLYLELMSLVKMKEKLGLAGIKPHLLALAMLTAFFVAASLFAIRSIEYVCPFACLLGAALAEELRQGRLSFDYKPKAMTLAMAASLGIALFAAFDYLEFKRTPHPPWLPCTGVMAWLDCNVPKDSVVVNLNWGDFPMMIYSSSKYRYVWGMDPMFTYAKNKEAAMLLDSTCKKGVLPNAWKIRSLTGSDYAVTLGFKMEQILLCFGWKILYDGADGAVFSLNAQGP